MRALISSAITAGLSLTALVAPGPALAEIPTSDISTSVRSESGSTGLASNVSSVPVTSRTTSMDFSTGSQIALVTIRLGVDTSQMDYRRYLITDRFGNEHPLSQDTFGSEFNLRLATDFSIDHNSFSLETSQTVNPSPFPGATFKAIYSHEIYPAGTRLIGSLSRSSYSAPLSYFINPENFQTVARPIKNIQDRVSIAAEQILNESLKAKMEIFSASRPAYRPNNQGTELSLAQALNSTSALHLKTGALIEQRTSELYDDRGYMDAFWGQMEFRYQPTYRWSLSTLLGTLMETESSRGNLPFQKVGTDSIGAETRYLGRFWEFGIKGLASKSNTDYQSFQIGGDFKWQI